MKLLRCRETSQTPSSFLRQIGDVFAEFDATTQDSGNVSYGVAVDGERFFVKTAGSPCQAAFLCHEERVAWLRNAQRVNAAVSHPALPRLLNVVESPHGPMLVSEWVAGESLYPTAREDVAGSVPSRFRALPLGELVAALTSIFSVHAALSDEGWVACDFYDGSIIYDFDEASIYLVDLDMYRDGPFVNNMGRMFGSSRFMAPEEYELGAAIDERTTVFNLGRCASVFLSRRALDADRSRLNRLLLVGKTACRRDPADRYRTLRAFSQAWATASHVPSV